MPALYDHLLTVTPDAIDRQGHAGNVEYVRWMQDAAIAHSNVRGWTADRYAEIGGAWVVRSHHVEYLKPAFAGEVITVRTWVASFEKIRSLRRYHLLRGDALIARAETLWVWVEMPSGRPRPVPDQVAASFEIVPDTDAS
jgi:acyl-CoA thioester hydrolase